MLPEINRIANFEKKQLHASLLLALPLDEESMLRGGGHVCALNPKVPRPDPLSP
jgi:hypothetical protein